MTEAAVAEGAVAEGTYSPSFAGHSSPAKRSARACGVSATGPTSAGLARRDDGAGQDHRSGGLEPRRAGTRGGPLDEWKCSWVPWVWVVESLRLLERFQRHDGVGDQAAVALRGRASA